MSVATHPVPPVKLHPRVPQGQLGNDLRLGVIVPELHNKLPTWIFSP